MTIYNQSVYWFIDKQRGKTMNIYYNEKRKIYHVGMRKFDSFLAAKHHIDTRIEGNGAIRDGLGFAAFIFMLLYAVPWIYYLTTGDMINF